MKWPTDLLTFDPNFQWYIQVVAPCGECGSRSVLGSSLRGVCSWKRRFIHFCFGILMRSMVELFQFFGDGNPSKYAEVEKVGVFFSRVKFSYLFVQFCGQILISSNAQMLKLLWHTYLHFVDWIMANLGKGTIHWVSGMETIFCKNLIQYVQKTRLQGISFREGVD